MFPRVDPGMGMTRDMGAGNVRRYPRLAAKVQSVNMRCDLGDRSVMLREIVDEHRTAWRIFVEDGLQRRAFRPLIGEDLEVDAMLGQLACAVFGAVIL